MLLFGGGGPCFPVDVLQYSWFSLSFYSFHDSSFVFYCMQLCIIIWLMPSTLGHFALDAKGSLDNFAHVVFGKSRLCSYVSGKHGLFVVRKLADLL